MAEREGAAYHETEHAAAAYAYGLPFQHASIVADGTTLGHVRY